MKILNLLSQKNNPYINFIKLLSFYLILGGMILFVVLIPVYSEHLDPSKLIKPNVIKLIAFVFGAFTTMIFILLTIGCLFASLFNFIASKTKINLLGTSNPLTWREYLTQLGLVALAASTVFSAIATYIYTL